MSQSLLTFCQFTLDRDNRQLTRDGVPIELGSRYLDALILLVSANGQLVSKDRFLEEVWKEIPVTDEVITQCVKTLRKQLGDDATSPRYIETVPKHGYRFIASVKSTADQRYDRRRQFVDLGTAGTIGGGIAGVLGGSIYGFVAASQTVDPGTGAISVLLIVLSMTILIASLGAAGVAFGIAAASSFVRHSWLASVAGGALGGLIVGAVVKLLGIDAFNLLFGQSPGDVAVATEGVVLGGTVGFAAWLARQRTASLSTNRAIACSAIVGAGAGIVIVLFGGRLMVGSLDLLVRQFSGSRLRIDQIGRLFGETNFSETAQIATGGLEGALFAASIVGAILIAHRKWNATSVANPP